ncbi:MAG: adenylate/guanylate cyclase domain-containing protein [Treponema sp.]|nr:adenylate/guanylate cyclase domain-containing protein [Treponema sp.]
MSSKVKYIVRYAVISLSVFLAGMILNFCGVFTFLENKTYDKRIQSTTPFTKPNDDIFVIGIDQDSINKALADFNWGWPWPRSAYAEIVDFMREGKASSVTFDVFYTEPSVYGPEDDEIFAKSCENYGRVIHTMFVSDDNKPLFPVEGIKNASALLGNITSAKDSDDVIRRARLSFTLDGKEYPALGIAPLLLDADQSLSDHDFFDESGDQIISDDDSADSVEKKVSPASAEEMLSYFKNQLPVSKDGTVLLRYKGDISRYYPYSAYEIIKSWRLYKEGKESELLPSDFEGASVFFIFYAPGLYDICSTPVSQIYPGAGVHVTMLDNILSGDFIRMPPVWFMIIYALVWTIISSFSVYYAENGSQRLKNVKIITFFTIGILLILGIAWGVFLLNITIQIITPLFCFVISFFVTIFVNYTSEGKQRRFIKSAFSQYLSPSVIDRLIQHPEKLRLGGEKRRISIFFSDIQGFTSISEKLNPSQLTDLLNHYLTEMTNIILASGGTIDKYEGDAIIAFWNAPTEIPSHAECALMAALSCQKKLEELSNEFTQKVGRPLWTRIGINTGEAVVGNMGSDQRFDYTMFGDSVNLASRLESMNKQFGTYTMCSENTKNEVDDSGNRYRWRELGRVQVIGKKNAVTVYEPYLEQSYRKKESVLKFFEMGLKRFYEGNFNEAIVFFSKIERFDMPARKYIERCKKLIKNPPENWNGVWVADTK